ncbi:hypothetical protein N7462_011005 [Penicillium macrosclerotiorum]|uniref:uncharacterized protein n=1 Tax=Penicillium macrosclerotiorum TaxID=303699 RepID=UPI0025471754|nr:uncharacterized protein N7462_011005 [Penicillium macrosclerotiorum]KAJ5666596.1 hypothetical protein N7462_011005 [Penicillium macrosclerotiorum]
MLDSPTAQRWRTRGIPPCDWPPSNESSAGTGGTWPLLHHLQTTSNAFNIVALSMHPNPALIFY